MADKKKILFWPDVYKEQGHWLPTLAWADYLSSLEEDGEKLYSIAFMGIMDCKQIVDDYNAANGTDFFYYPIFTKTYPEGYTAQVQATTNERWKPDHIKCLMYARFEKKGEMEEAGASELQIKDALALRAFLTDEHTKGDYSEYYNTLSGDEEDAFDSNVEKYGNPDLIISGYFTSMETAILYHLSKKSNDFNENMKFAFSTTYLRHPSEDPASRVLQNLQAFNDYEQRILLNILMPEEVDRDELDKDPEFSIEDFISPLTNFDEFIPCPKIFDYSHYEHGNKVHYVEPCINKELALPNGVSPIDVWEDFLAEHDKIVFVTAGSQILDYKDKAVVLFQSIIGAMQASDMKGYHLIICAGSTLVQELSSDYENVTICGWAPQHKILSTLAQSKHKGSCAIIHGGLATIKECVYYEVPFLVLPLGKDQMDNALRLEDCGINNRFHLEYIKPKCLRYFINQILQDYKSRLNLKKLSGVFHKSEESHIGANAIAHLATNGTLDGFEW